MLHLIRVILRTGSYLLFMVILLTACGTPSTTTAPPTQTEPVQPVRPTVASLPTETLPAPTKTAVPMPPTSAASPTIISSATAAFTPTPCINKARFVSETLPDNAEVKSGSVFTKSWTLENTGTCTWDTAYSLELVTGSGFSLAGSQAGLRLAEQTAPGGRQTVSVTLTAPAEAGTYRADFYLRSAQNEQFGIGSQGTSPFYLQVVVTAAETVVVTQPAGCLNKARFVGETLPDDTAILAGSSFKKSWTLENNGTCTWTTSYAVRFDTGTFMGSSAQTFALPKTVKPGERITLEVSLTAPAKPGTYTANYLLVDESGKTFGIGSSATSPFYVRIVSRACTYKAALLSETFPPGTKVWVGEVFEKVWTVQNTGDCTWYGIHHPWVTDGGFGYPPGAPRNGNPQGDVLPGASFELGLPLVAPMQAGSQRAEFKIGFSTDTTYKYDGLIGVGENGSGLLTADVTTVEPPSSEANLGDPAIFDTFDKDEGWWSLAQASNAYVTFSISGGALEMAIKQGYEYFNVRTMTERRGQIHQAVFSTGPNCSGKNAYGLLISLNPDTGSGSYRWGHLIRVTCDGQYSVEYLDETAYQSGGKPIVLVPLTGTAAIHAGPNQTNRVTVIAAGGRMYVLINGVKVVELEQASKFRAIQYESGKVSAQFDLDLSQFFYVVRPYNGPGLPGLFIDGEESSHTVRVEEYKFWNLDEMVK